MIPVVSSTPQVFDAGHELGHLLESRGWDVLRRRRADECQLNLAAALDELQSWLDDARTYTNKHKKPWTTMASDVAATFNFRGPSSVTKTLSLNALVQELQGPLLGADTPRRNKCRQLVINGRAELATSSTAVAAFDDLLAATQDPSNTPSTLVALAEVLEDCLALSGRTVSALLSGIGSVMGNNLQGVKIASRHLGDPATIDRNDIFRDAGLTLPQRAALCQRLLQHQDPPSEHVVWLCYEEAQIRLHTIDFGPITFFDGKDLLEAMAEGADLYHHVDHPDGSQGFVLTPVPAELLDVDNAESPRRFTWPDLENWVAVRVDLGHGQMVDPAGAAIQQVDSLVRLAGFHSDGSSWRRLHGYIYLRDGVQQGGPWIQKRPSLNTLLTDNTDFKLIELSTPLATHLLITDPNLQQLLDAAAVLDGHLDELDPTSIGPSVGAVSRVADLCGVEWYDHLINNFAVGWARGSIKDTILGAIWGIRDVEGLTTMPSDTLLYEYTGEGRAIHLNVALSAMPHLGRELPIHHPAARLVRTVAARTATPADLEEWVAELVARFERLINRLVRCRNSLTHGGPFRNTTAESVQLFARNQAKRNVHIALWTVASGNPLQQGIQDHSQAHEQWRRNIPNLEQVADAFS